MAADARYFDPAQKTGANDGDRTRDNRYHKPALYQLSYVRHRMA